MSCIFTSLQNLFSVPSRRPLARRPAHARRQLAFTSVSEALEPRQVLAATIGATLLKDINTTSFTPGLQVLPESNFSGTYSAAFKNSLYYAENAAVWKVSATGTEKLVDVLPGEEFVTIRRFAVSGDRLYFTGDNGVGSASLWVSDGTTPGTKILFPDGEVCRFPELLTDANGTLFFVASDSPHGYELWTSDGTEAGTRMVVDLYPGTISPFIQEITKIGNDVYFVATLPDSGRELWRSDGTASGTSLVADIVPGVAGSFPRNLTAVGNRLYFNVDIPGGGVQLWTTDGTAAGTVPVLDTSGNPMSGSTSACAAGSILIFAGTGATGTELWKADGSLAAPILDIRPGEFGSFPTSFTYLNGRTYFSASAGVAGRELWSTDGTTAGTALVASAIPSGPWDPKDFVVASGVLFFTAETLSAGREFWRTDGTAAGTYQLIDINPGATSSPSSLGLAKSDGGLLYFAVDEASNRTQIWLSDGTVSGTRRASRVETMENGGSPTYFTEVNGTLFFAANSGGISSPGEIWKTDGTSAGTQRVRDISPDDASGFVINLTEWSGKLYFASADAKGNYELWKSDGTEDGTQRLKNINPGGSIGRTTFTKSNNLLYFDANDGVHGTELWKTDGTEAGTQLVANIGPGSDSSFPFQRIAALGSLFFTADDGINGLELWKTDGTAQGTVLVKDLNPTGSSLPRNYVEVGGKLYFAAALPELGELLWVSDGTETGTRPLTDSSGASLAVQNLVAAGGRLLFTTLSTNGEVLLWRTDGTTAGTTVVTTILSYDYESPELIADEAGSLAYFSIRAEIYGQELPRHGRELWRTDGTAEGTFLLRDIKPGPGSSNPVIQHSVGNIVFFTANNGLNGVELWYTNGTPTGTHLVADLQPGVAPLQLSDLTWFQNRLMIGGGLDADYELYELDDFFITSGSFPTFDEDQIFTTNITLPTTDPAASVRVSTSNSLLFPPELIFLTGTGLNRVLNVTPAPNSSGTGVITLTIGEGDAAQELPIRLTVQPVNDAPTVAPIRDFRIQQDASRLRLGLHDITAGGEEAQPLRVTASSSQPGLIPDPQVEYSSAASTGALLLQPNAGATGTATITVVVTDGGLDGDLGTPDDNLSVTRSFVITVLTKRTTITGPVGTIREQRPRISWTPVPDALSYTVWIGNRSTGQMPMFTATTTVTEYQPAVDLGIGRFDVYVRAEFGHSAGPWSNANRFIINTPTSFVPINSRQTTSRPNITLNTLAGAAKYDIWVDNLTTGASQFIRTLVNGPGWTPSVDLELSRYRIFARGIAADGMAATWGPALEFTVATPPRPIAPTSATFDRNQTFSWSTVAGAASYGFYLRNQNTGAIVADLTGLTTTSWTPATSLPEGSYSWWVIADTTLPGIRSNWSARVDVYIGGRPVAIAPKGIVGTATPTLRWNPVIGAVTYEVWINRINPNQSQFNVFNAAGITATSFTLQQPLTPGRSYRYWIRAVSSTGKVSPWSLPQDFSVQLADSGSERIQPEPLAPELQQLVSLVPEDDGVQQHLSTQPATVETATPEIPTALETPITADADLIASATDALIEDLVEWLVIGAAQAS
ncbi:MAG: ELWxxDGT repeat protein [Planctomycetaceae bacterium]